MIYMCDRNEIKEVAKRTGILHLVLQIFKVCQFHGGANVQVALSFYHFTLCPPW